MEILTLKPEAFGLDISDLSLKIAKLRKKGKFFDLVSWGQRNMPPGLIKGGEIKDEKGLAEIIKTAIKNIQGERLRTKYVVASLPEEKAFLEVIQMPRLSQEDLKSAIIYEAENYIPLPIEEVYLDFWVVPPMVDNLDHLDVLICALPQKTVDPYLNTLKLANLEPKVLEIESLAISRALIKEEISSTPLFLIDLGATRSGFTIFSDHSPRFTSSIPISGQLFDKMISSNFGLDLKKAEKLKIKYGLEEKNKLKIGGQGSEIEREKGKIFEALIPSLIDLVQQIKRHLEYYQSHSSHEHLPPDGKEISKILLCGGGANLKGLKEFLSRKLNLEVELGNPWVNILLEGKNKIPPIGLEESLKYTTALGLAIRGIR